MSWFDEQIRQRKESDREVFEDSFVRLAGIVLGRRKAKVLSDEQVVTKAAVDEILKYYRIKPKEVPELITSPDEQLEYLLRPHGIMYRNIDLGGKWYNDAYGPILAFRKADGLAVALLPRSFGGYCYKDFDTGRKIAINGYTAKTLETAAICFYHPLPLRRIGVVDLYRYMGTCIRMGDYAFVLIAAAVVTGVGYLIPVISRALTGKVLESGSVTLLAGIAAFMLCTAVSKQLMTTLQRLVNGRIKTKIGVSLEAAAFMRVLTLPSGFFRRYSSGELATRARSLKQLSEIVLGAVAVSALNSVMSLVYIRQIFSYAQPLVVPSLLMLAASLVISIGSAVVQIGVSTRQMRAAARESGMTYALISGMKKIKLAGAEKRAFARWAEVYSESARYTYDPPMFIKLNGVITMAVTLLGNIGLYYLAAANGIGVADYIAFNAAFGMVIGAFGQLAGIALTVAQIPPILDMAKPIMDAVPEVNENKQVVSHLSGSFELSNVSFRYNENMPYVIEDLTLKVRSGEYVAIVGRTGCGKSTLMRLLLGFEKPDRGAVYYDGKDISNIDLRSLRRRIGAVTQDGSLFQGDIFSNIVISSPDLTIDDAWKAAELAGIADDIREMPMGMYTMISEGGGGISGGQKQRIMIARAIAHKPKILMFDEATSALDNKTQRQVSDALDSLKCTRIVIAHRLSTIKNCDRILFLENGRIVEDGTYDELIALDGRFAELVKKQQIDR